MQIQINGDHHVKLSQQAMEQWQGEIEDAMKRFGDWITRIEVHVTDENSLAKGGPNDIRCLMEARPASQKPVSVEVREATIAQAIREGVRTLQRRLGSMVDKARAERRDQR